MIPPAQNLTVTGLSACTNLTHEWFCGKNLHVHDGHNPKREAQLNDTWIAACALAHGLTLVNDNSRDFEWMREAVGLDLVSYPSA
jgi:predicted nucleic acid-binding protein